MTEIDDPKRVLAELLKDDWNSGNTLGITPDIRTGWRDRNLADPTVTVSNDEESPTGATGFSGFKGDGSGPTSTTRGSVQVNVWTTHDMTAENGKQLASEFSKEVKRVVRANLDPSQHAFGIAGLTAENYRYIAWGGREFLPEDPDDEDDPIEFRYLCPILYEYLDEP